MPYLPDLNTYLYNSSLLIQAYPDSRITTKYALPRKPNTKSKSQTPSKRSQKADSATEPVDASATDGRTRQQQREKKEPSAILVLKTYHADSGICLKYRTDKAQEVGRLMAGLGRLAKGEIIEMPTTAGPNATGQVDGDAMEVDSGPVVAPKAGDKVVTATPVSQQTQGQQEGGGGGGGKKKKKGKK